MITFNKYNCLMNASGCWCVTKTDLDELGLSMTGCIVSKSSTLQKRDGNPHPRQYFDQYGSINSSGLPNLGYEFYMNYKKNSSKPYIQSIYPFSNDELKIMLENLNKNVVNHMVELNLSCPNLIGKQSTNFDRYEEYIKTVDAINTTNLIIGLKLPPFYELIDYQKMYDIINKTNKIKFITCCNSLVNGLIIDPDNETTCIKPKDGLGGVGGVYCKPVCLANVYNFYKLFGKDIMIIGCGGIKNGKDVFEYILCGASAVQIGTQLMVEGPVCFERILREFQEYIESKGYENIEDFQGKLQTIF